jgi:hypothetical protein
VNFLGALNKQTKREKLIWVGLDFKSPVQKIASDAEDAAIA